MNWMIVFKFLSIIFALTAFISVICTGMWIYLRQQKESTSVVSTPDSNTPDYGDVKSDLNKNLTSKIKDYNNINLEKSNVKNNTYDVTNRTLIKVDEIIELKNKNNSTSTVKSISTNYTESTSLIDQTQDQISDSRKTIYPNIENRFSYNPSRTKLLKNDDTQTTKINLDIYLEKIPLTLTTTQKTITGKMNNGVGIKGSIGSLAIDSQNINKSKIESVKTTVPSISTTEEATSERSDYNFKDVIVTTESNLDSHVGIPNNQNFLGVIYNEEEINEEYSTIIDTTTIADNDGESRTTEISTDKSKVNSVEPTIILTSTFNEEATETNLDIEIDQPDLLLAASTITETTTLAESDSVNEDILTPEDIKLFIKNDNQTNFTNINSKEQINLSIENSTNFSNNCTETNEKNISTPSAMKEEIKTEIQLPKIDNFDTFNRLQIQNPELSYPPALNISIEAETDDNKSGVFKLNIFINDTKVIFSNNTENNDFKTPKLSNSSSNFNKDNKSKNLIIVTPTTIDSEVIISFENQSKEINNKTDLLVVVTPSAIDRDNVLNSNNENQSDLDNSTTDENTNIPESSSDGKDFSIFYDDINEHTEVGIPVTGEEFKCYGELGCLSISPSWYDTLHRHSNVLPLSREIVDTRIIIYTRDDPVEGQVIIVSEIKSVEQINFNPKRKTKFIIHGFNSSPHVGWVKEMKYEFLQHDDFNVIVVDWSGGSSLLGGYTQAAGNSRLVGLEVAHVIIYLHTEYNLNLNDVHLVGHSLGAHIAGYAGEKLRGKIGRITGLDPAMPDFERMPGHVRLDFTDAKFVDVIHTDSDRILRLGIYQPCGHLDFYPNNGDDQPGCSDSSFGEVCDHTRAIKLFTESINSKCQFIAHECSTYAKFIAGECFLCNSSNSVNCGIMGFNADKSPALPQKLTVEESDINPFFIPKFFISTGDKYPYCRRHYRITIKLANPSIAKAWLQGFMNVTLYANNAIIYNMELTPNDNRIKLSHGMTKQIVALPPEDAEYSIGRVRKVELSWTYNSNELLYKCFFCNDRLYVESIVVDMLELTPERKKREMDLSSTLCSIQGPQKYTEILSGSSAPFVDNCS